MYIKDVERKSIKLTNVLRYRKDSKDSDEMIREVNDYLLFNQIARSDAYVIIEHGRSRINKELLDIEILVPINGSANDGTDERFEFLPTVTFDDVVSVYFRGSLRLYKVCMGRLSAYLKANNLKPCSTIRMRYYRDKDNINENHDIAVEMFIEVEESRVPRDPAEKLSSAEKQAFYDRAVTILEGKLSTVECCESIYSLSLVDIDSGIVSLAADNELAMNITRTKYKDIIEDAFREAMNVNTVALYLTLEEDDEDDEEYTVGLVPEFGDSVHVYSKDPELLDGILDNIKKVLRSEVSESAYNEFIAPLYLNAISSRLASFCCPDDIADELDDKYEQIIKYACEEVLGVTDYMVVFVSDDDDEYEDIDDGQEEDNSIYSEEEKELIFEKAKDFIRQNVSPLVYSDYIEILECEYITKNGFTMFCVYDEEESLIPEIEEKYKSLIEKGLRFAIGCDSAGFEIKTSSELIDIYMDRLVASTRDMNKRIDTLREKIRSVLDEDEETDNDVYPESKKITLGELFADYINPEGGKADGRSE